ncbi:hypothetical protein [Streptomyces tubercidicus]|uniref:hypothetical protein n=1 Tax=Streptomyces tubercidicus TaxID=47759 RepID=UPI00368ABDB5
MWRLEEKEVVRVVSGSTGQELDHTRKKKLAALEEEIQDAANNSCGLIRGGWVDQGGEWDTGEARPPMVHITTVDGHVWEMAPEEFRSYVWGYEHMVRYLFGDGTAGLRDHLLGLAGKATARCEQNSLAEQILDLADWRPGSDTCGSQPGDARDEPSATPEEFRSCVSGYEEMVRHLFGRESKELSDLRELGAALRDVLARTGSDEQGIVDRMRRELGSGDRDQPDPATEAR